MVLGSNYSWQNRIAAFHYEVQDFKSLIKVKIKDLALYPLQELRLL